MSQNSAYVAINSNETLVIIDQRPMHVVNAVLLSYALLQAYLTVNHPSISAQSAGDKAHHQSRALGAGITMGN